jgi:LysR family transcriptional regulator, glycine cleavage system transcriptional activator
MTPEPDAIRLPSIDALRAFETAARLGSFERAAEVLHITASAVSKRVAGLESQLGSSLLQRGGKTLVLTLAGKEYLDQVSAALVLLAAVPLHRATQRRAQAQRQRLRVCTPPTFARQILVPHLQQFTDLHPEVDLELMLSIPYLGSHTVEADVEVRTGEWMLEAPASGGQRLMQDAVLPMASPALLSRFAPLRGPADLAQLPLLRTPLEPWAPWFAAAGLPWPEPQSGPKLVDLGLTLEAAVSGQGVVLARPSLARAWVVSGALLPLFRVTAEPVNSYYLQRHASNEAAQGFSGWLLDLCERVAQDALRDVLSQVRSA